MMTEVQTKTMSVNLEIKGMLARLLATEDLIVEHKNVDTACFNVQTRCLTLPLWEKASDKVYDLLVAHEVGHSLETPQDEWEKEYDIPMQFVNVTEDARIEKLMKRRYPGLPRTFYTGYKELYEDDFFCLEGEDITKMNLADRANLYFKIGNFVPIKFTEKEQEIINLISNAESFTDALNAAQVLYDYCKNKEEFDVLDVSIPVSTLTFGESETNQNIGMTQGSIPDMEDDSEQQNLSDQSNHPQGSSESIPSTENTKSESKAQSENDNTSKNASKDDQNKEPEVKTVDSLKKSIESLVNQKSSDSLYFELPDVDLNTIIVDCNEIYDHIRKDFATQQHEYQHINIFSTPDSEYSGFKISAQKEVNYLVKEFEAKKAATSYARAATSTTGVLDCSRLHTYKFNDDLFKRVTTLSDGKNHGLIFILDWSGSMSEVMMDTIKQLYNLIWFCKKVSIPFEVYAFSCHWGHKVTYDDQGKPIYPKKHYVEKDGFTCLDESFTLLNIFTSKVNNRVLDDQMKNMWRVCSTFKYQWKKTLNCPSRLGLSGTPLNESLVCLHKIIPMFEKANKLEKVHCVILTDGEANPLTVHKSHTNWAGEKVLQRAYINLETSYLRDRKIGSTYKFTSCPFNFSATLLRNLKDNFPHVSFIGMRILNSREVNVFINRYVNNLEYTNKLIESWKKDRSFSINTAGYDIYFGLSSTALAVDSQFKVHEDASKIQIKNAFMKSLKSKKMNKKILKEFISLIS